MEAECIITLHEALSERLERAVTTACFTSGQSVFLISLTKSGIAPASFKTARLSSEEATAAAAAAAKRGRNEDRQYPIYDQRNLTESPSHLSLPYSNHHPTPTRS